MPEIDPTFLNWLTNIDHTNLGILCCFLGFILYTYRPQIFSFVDKKFGTNLSGKSTDSNKNEQQDEVMSLLMELKSEISDMKEKQTGIIESQDNLQKEISSFKKDTHDRMNRISDVQEFLLDADKEDKKAFITREYNYFYISLKKIDLYSRETIEKIYELYLQENGDTFVAGMMTAIRSLEVVPQITNDDLIKAGLTTPRH